MKVIGLVFLIALTSCHPKSKENVVEGKGKMISGEIGGFNNSKNSIGVAVIADNREYNLGIVSKKGGAVIGSAKISVGGKLAVLWREEFPDGTLKDYTAEFNSSELADVAGKVKGMKFTYLGNQSWQLEVFGALHMYSKDLLKTVKSVDSKEVVEETKENGGQ